MRTKDTDKNYREQGSIEDIEALSSAGIEASQLERKWIIVSPENLDEFVTVFQCLYCVILIRPSWLMTVLVCDRLSSTTLSLLKRETGFQKI